MEEENDFRAGGTYWTFLILFECIHVIRFHANKILASALIACYRFCS
jgi:hypothetical protein